MATPLVSIITPAYNSAGFIGETISAAIAQTFRDFELIVVDDESTDDTIDAVLKPADGDPRVIVMVAAHGGPAAARNAGLDVARGRFIALLDSDDVWMPNYLSEQLATLQTFPQHDVVTANAITRGGALDGRPVWTPSVGLRDLDLRDLILQENSVCIMSVFRRKVIERITGFDPRFTGNEDYEFWLRAANAGFRFVQDRRPLGFYRRREGSVSADEVRMLRGIIGVLEAANRMRGSMQRERAALEQQLQRFRRELIKAEMRASLANDDAPAAARSLKALSEVSGSLGLSVAARVSLAWPNLLRHVYELRRSLRAS